ncbi:MAG: glycoside hydrolase family 127 protein, partial [Clostridia bacterium]|nr:glycoside hydrolase family 127 protein [Clostridia bacterium]
HIAPYFVAANPNVRANAGRVALCYGPIVYCLEGADNGAYLNRIEVEPCATQAATLEKDFHNLYSISLPAFRCEDISSLYVDADEVRFAPIVAKFIPYFAFANRGESDMLVWVRKR